MRNQYPGECYRCNVETGRGHFERFGNGWRLQHATYAIDARVAKAKASIAKFDTIIANLEDF